MAHLSDEWNAARIKEILEDEYPKEKKKLIEGFAEYIKTANFTLESQKTKLLHIQTFFKQIGSRKVSSLSKAEIDSHMEAAEINEMKISLKYFFDWLKHDPKNKSFEQIQRDARTRRIEAIMNFKGFKEYQKKILEDYYGHLQRGSYRLETKRAYLQQLKQLLLDLDKEPGQVTKQDINNYLEHINKKYKATTAFERRMFLVNFFEWFYDKPQTKIDLVKDISFKKHNGTKLPDEILSPEEIKKMVQVADNFRDKALIILLYETAARKGEFLQIKIKHIDLVNKEYAMVTIPMGKTDSRKIPLIYSVQHIQNWLNSHPNRNDPNSPVFITQGAWLGRALGEDGLKRRLKILGLRAGIKKKIYPHLFRHSRLTELAKELTEQELKKFAGWTPNSNMASVYVHLSGSDVSNKILANAGLIDSSESQKGKSVLQSVRCPRCDKLNSADTKYCSCGFILDIKEINKVLEERSNTEKYLEKFMKPGEMQKLFKLFYKLEKML